MAKDMFYYSGLVSGQDHTNGKCGDCPYLKFEEGNWICTQTEADVSNTAIHGTKNMNCPFITK